MEGRQGRGGGVGRRREGTSWGGEVGIRVGNSRGRQEEWGRKLLKRRREDRRGKTKEGEAVVGEAAGVGEAEVGKAQKGSVQCTVYSVQYLYIS